jgi:hypothetical protein
VHKLFSIGIAIAVSLICVAAVQSMPLVSLEQTQTSLTIPVAGGCGAGFHRGANGRCYRNAAVVAPGVAVTAPGVAVTAPGVHVAPHCRRVCNQYGCRRVC